MATPERPPAVVLIVADALRADRLEARRAGVEVMPSLRALAARSWHYARAYSQASWTKPAMASLLTSLDPEVHQVLFGPHALVAPGQSPLADALPPDLDGMTQLLAGAGYRAAAIQTNPNLGAGSGFDRGFEPYEVCPDPRCRADRVTERALALLRRAGPPLFLYVHYMDPHAPYDPPEPYRSRFGRLPELPEADRRLLADHAAFYLDRVLHEVGLTGRRRLPDPSPAARRHLAALYDGEASFLDAEIGRLLEGIDRARPGALVVVTADHGEELWDHGSIGHAKTLYEELVHVPLVIRAAGAAPLRIEEPVEIVDLLPTLAELLALPASPAWQGRSVTPGRLPRAGAVFSSTRMSIAGSNVDLECAILGTDKLIVDRRRGAARLYDLAVDPAEAHPRPPDGAAAAALREALEARRRADRAHPRFGTPPPRYRIGGETERSLRALGYLR